MDDRPGTLAWQAPAQLHQHAVELGFLVDLGGLPLLRPAPQLALHVPGRAPELGQPDGRRVERMQLGQHVDERLADGAPLLRTLGVAGGQRVAADVPDHALHHVERGAERTVRGADVEGARDRHARSLERAQHALLAHHVVGRREDVPERRAAQHDFAGIRAHAVREVGLAAGDQRDVAHAPALVVQRLGEQRPDDVRLGARGDPLQSLGGRIVEARGHRTAPAVAGVANLRPSRRSWYAASPNCCSRTTIRRR